MGAIEVIKRQKGQQGLDQGKTQTICNLILKLDLSDEQIAYAAEVSVSFVKKIRAYGIGNTAKRTDPPEDRD